MSLIAEIEGEMQEAMRTRDAERRDALRLILASLRGAEKELQRPLSDDEELQVLQRERKRRRTGRTWQTSAGRRGRRRATTRRRSSATRWSTRRTTAATRASPGCSTAASTSIRARTSA